MSVKAYPHLGDWLSVAGGVLRVSTGKVDIGQRISTALAQIAEDELTISHHAIEVVPVRTDACPDEGMTSGSNSIEQSGHSVRHAAATLRREVFRLAAARLGGSIEDWSLADGALTRRGLNRPVPLVDLAADVDPQTPVDVAAPIRPPPPTPPQPAMRGLRDLVEGRYRFLHDLDVPGLWHARMVRPPHAGARLVTVPDRAADAIRAQGVAIVRDGSVLAVAGAREWPVVRAAERLSAACRWSTGDGLDDRDVFDALRPENAVRLVVEEGRPVHREPPPPLAAPTHSARYERPFTMHGALAPSAALATYDGARLSVVSHSQGIYPLRESLAQSLDLPLDRVAVAFAPGSGCYGHNGADDAALDAALIAMARPGTPILLKWSRQDEHGFEPYGPPQAVEVAATLDDSGAIAAFSSEATGGTYRGRPRPGAGRAGPARLLANTMRAAPIPPYRPEPNMNRQGGIHRNLDPAYTVGALRCVKNLVPELPLRTSALRCLGATANVFAIESFIDELAARTGRDPLSFRRAHLGDARAMAVLDQLAAHIEAWPARGEGEGRGIAYAQYKNAQTRAGVAVDLAVNDRAEITLQRAVIVADAGRVIDRDGLAAQLEGGFVQAASWALHEEVTWDREGVTSRDWESYPVIRFDNIPQIDVVLIPRQNEKAVGAGEASPGPAVAAIANAVTAATGIRIRRLPLTPERIMAEAARL